MKTLRSFTSIIVSSLLFSGSLFAGSMEQEELYTDMIVAASEGSLFFFNRSEFRCSSEDSCLDLLKAGSQFLFDYSDQLGLFQMNNIRNILPVSKLKKIKQEDLADVYLLDRLYFSEEKSFTEYSRAKKSNEIWNRKTEARLCEYNEYLEKDDLQKLSCAQYISNNPDLNNLDELFGRIHGRYSDRTKLFMFCRQDRKFPCYFLMQDPAGDFVSYDDGSLWGQPALGYSRKKKAATKKDGHTPRGVLLVNGVMPSANKQSIFGKFRRLILDFTNETNLRQILPASHMDQDWWKQAQVAKDVGRLYLRIHGTGMRNANERRSYYPFVATRGCVAQREGSYRSLSPDRFTDQRKLLDALMLAQGLEPVYENESSIRSILYLVELDNKKEAVSREEVVSLVQ